MKRSNEVEDMEDVDVTSDGSDEACSGKGLCKKKRRGLIEKRRRDRINGCLLELRHLVPEAFEKQGSSKLEKAEILSLTVEHLRSLRHCQNDSEDDATAGTNYHEKGFHECLSEVKCYISTLEGLQSNEDFRNQLVNHLSIYKSTRNNFYQHSAAGINASQRVVNAPIYSVAAVPRDVPKEMKTEHSSVNSEQDSKSFRLYTTGTLFNHQNMPHLNLNSAQYHMPVLSRPGLNPAVSSNQGPITLFGSQLVRAPLTQPGINHLSQWPSLVMGSSSSNIVF